MLGQSKLQTSACLLPYTLHGSTSSLHESTNRFHVPLRGFEEFSYFNNKLRVVHEFHAFQLHGQCCIGTPIDRVFLKSELEKRILLLFVFFITITIFGRLIVVELLDTLVIGDRWCIFDCDKLREQATFSSTIIQAHALQSNLDEHGICALQKLRAETIKQETQYLFRLAMRISLECEATCSQAHVDFHLHVFLRHVDRFGDRILFIPVNGVIQLLALFVCHLGVVLIVFLLLRAPNP